MTSKWRFITHGKHFINGHCSIWVNSDECWIANLHANPLLSQFSDNGLVQFQSAAENEQYLFPAPLASGFPIMNVSLLAPFWDDADLTLGQGRLLYQVHHQYIDQIHAG